MSSADFQDRLYLIVCTLKSVCKSIKKTTKRFVYLFLFTIFAVRYFPCHIDSPKTEEISNISKGYANFAYLAF